MNNEIQIAKILRPHGVKGTLKVAPLVDALPFSKFDRLIVGMHKQSMHVKHISPLHQFYLVQLDEINSCEEAEFFRNQGIWVDKNLYPEIFDDFVATADYIGTNVFDESGKKIGVVVDYEEYGSAPVVSINCGGTTYMVPFVEDVLHYDKSKQEMIVNSKRFLETRV